MERFASMFLALALSWAPFSASAQQQTLTLGYLHEPVVVRTDELGVPHVYAKSDRDLFFTQGYLHARDRFFQMDVSRRAARGTLAELTGDAADLEQDAKARVLGLAAAAQRSYELLGLDELGMAHAYADGVNAWLATHSLPPEYGRLELTSVPRWSVQDSLVMAKGIALAERIVRDWEIAETAAYQSYVDALGEAGAAALYPADLGRFAPWAPYATVPDATGAPFGIARLPGRLPSATLAKAAAARRVRAPAKPTVLAAGAHERSEALAGSNAWGVAAAHSANGKPLLASDPHSPLTAPSNYYQNQLVVENDPRAGPLSVSGMTSPGIPGITSGQNTRLTWAWTSFYPDTSDFFQDRLVRDDPGCAARLCIDSAGTLHPVEERSERYLVNRLDGVLDNLVDFTIVVEFNDPGAVDVLTVPFRSFGPIVAVDDRSVVDGTGGTETTVVTLQYAGLHGTRDARALRAMLRATDVSSFGAAVRDWSVAAHFIVADVDGNLAYFAAAEIPLRADLEAGALAGPPPWQIRDGSGPSNWVPDPARSQGQAIPFAVIPPDEMPRVVNPPAGFVVNCNEDPSGFALDNDLLNQSRPSNPTAIHYLGDTSTRSLRNGRVTQLLRAKIDAGEPLSLDDMKRIQGNTQALHAEILVEPLLGAWAAAQEVGAPAELTAFAADARVAEAVGRLAAWDFSHPSGIPEGYDASDVDGVPNPVVSEAEARASVAATLYEVWFTKLLPRFSATISSLGLTPLRPVYTLVWLLEQEPFTGVGASGIQFFPEPAGLTAPQRRDWLLLSTLQQVLDALPGPAYAAAFAGSTSQDDYRWGKLNRVVFKHKLGGDSSIPPAAGFTHLAAGLPGLARDGAWDVVNVSSGFVLPDGAQAFAGSAGGSLFRFVVSPLAASPDGAGMLAFASLAGGASGDPASATYASQLATLLTVDYHEVPMTPTQVEQRTVLTEQLMPAAGGCGLGFELAIALPGLAWVARKARLERGRGDRA